MKPSVDDVLSEVNRVRAGRGMKPLDTMPAGTSCCDDCPLAHALDADYVEPGDELYAGTYSFRGEVELLPLPTVLDEFGRRFDEGAYPELVRQVEA